MVVWQTLIVSVTTPPTNRIILTLLLGNQPFKNPAAMQHNVWQDTKSCGVIWLVINTDHKCFVRWVWRQIICKSKFKSSVRRLNRFLSELISMQCGGALKEQFLTSLQVCQLKLPRFHYCFLVRLDKSKFCLSTCPKKIL